MVFSAHVCSINQVLAEMFGTDLVNAKRVINTKLSKNKPNPENLTLAERILLNRRKVRESNDTVCNINKIFRLI
jgi:hypothetical protein